jgi:hypothetical protein
MKWRGHWAYFKYVVRHKWGVWRGGRLLGVPRGRRLLHDWHKFLPREFFPYSRNFYHADGTPRARRDASGAYDPTQIGGDFDLAWLHHQRAKHHWQAWISLGDGGAVKALEIPEVYLREMIADWIGAGLAQGRCDPCGWYAANRHKLVLHASSRQALEALLEQYGTQLPPTPGARRTP